MKLNRFCTLLAVAVFATATTANAAVHRVSPGESIQEAIDGASPGDTILVEPGIYEEAGRFIDAGMTKKAGLHVTTDNLRLVGMVKQGQGEAGKVILLDPGDQHTGVYAAPDGCGPEVKGECLDEEDNALQLQDFYIRGFTVKDFPGNGIQTRFVDGFKIIRNESANNDHNGIYPTISANGLVQNNVSYGSEDTAMWVAASQNVRVLGNELYDSVIGLEVNVSLNVEVRHNEIHNNVVGIGLFHPNSAGNDPLPVMGNWVVEHNNVYDNNLFPNPAPENSFQGALPSGIGILVLGVSDTVVARNDVEDNGFVGIGVLGWCTATSTIPKFNCVEKPPIIPPLPDPDAVFYDPSVSDNLIAQNKLSENGTDPPPVGPPLDALAADLTYFTAGALAGESSSGNCFEKNKPKNGFTYVSSEPDMELPTDGC